jgi:hypothetical protein
MPEHRVLLVSPEISMIILIRKMRLGQQFTFHRVIFGLFQLAQRKNVVEMTIKE